MQNRNPDIRKRWAAGYTVFRKTQIEAVLSIEVERCGLIHLDHVATLLPSEDGQSLQARLTITSGELFYHLAELASGRVVPQTEYARRVDYRDRPRRKRKKTCKQKYKVATKERVRVVVVKPVSEWEGDKKEQKEEVEDKPEGFSRDPYNVTTGPIRSGAQMARANRPRPKGE